MAEKTRKNSKGKWSGGNKMSAARHIKAPYPHFRRYKKSGHPALIMGEHSAEAYEYRKVMHSEKDGKRTNEVIVPNPKPNDPNPMYIGKRTRHDKMHNFDNKPYPWKYPKK